MPVKSSAILSALVLLAVPVGRTIAQDRTPAADAKAPAKTAATGDAPRAGPGTSGSMDNTSTTAIKRVTGIGGVFIKAKDPAKLRAWYKTHLGIDVQAWGGTAFSWVDASGTPVKGKTAWMVGDGSNFAPSDAPYMINYRVADLTALMKLLREEGCNIVDKVEQSDFGSFGWVMDPEGNKVELWQPPAGQ